MGPVVTAIICALISFVAASVTIGREARRLDSFSPVPIYDVERAVAFVSGHLSYEVSSRISYWDVRKILDLSRADQAANGLSQESLVVQGPTRIIDELVIVADDRQTRIAHAATEAGLELTEADVKEVLNAEIGYLRAIGAVGPPAETAI